MGSDIFDIDHNYTETRNLPTTEIYDYDRIKARAAILRAKNRSFDVFDKGNEEIVIPDDPKVTFKIDNDRIKEEFEKKRNDMYAKYYGDKDYQREYSLRAERYRRNEMETTENGITYRTIAYYPEQEEDEKFLLLDKYKECLERVTRYRAGDTSVYSGTPNEITLKLQNDTEYVETRNHTFNQNANTQRDLATLGKYGERLPYIPRQQGVLKNIGRVLANASIAFRNAFTPIYRGIGRFVAQPLHRLRTRGRDASPYRNNIHHRVVARREYFLDEANRRNPTHRIRNVLGARWKSLFRAKEGNEAVLRAGAADIINNLKTQEMQKSTINVVREQITRLDEQITLLENAINNNPHARNVQDVKDAIQSKKNKRDILNSQLNQFLEKGIDGDIQTDAISSREHAIASKEVNTAKVTVIKGVMKGLAVKYLGPKIHEWLLERGKVTQTKQIITTDWRDKKEWVPSTYKTEMKPDYTTVLDTSKSMKDVISANKGKSITGFYSVSGGEYLPQTYNLTGDEKITAVFQSIGNGGTGLSDSAGLTAPILTDRTFSSTFLDSSGVLNQNISLDQMVNALNTGTVDLNTFNDVYVSIGDRYWTKLSDLAKGLVKKVKVGETPVTVVDVPGHFETVQELFKNTSNVSETIINPVWEQGVNIAGNVAKGAVAMDSVIDIVENVRPTTTDVNSNKTRPREYGFDDESLENIPTSKRDYNRQKEDEEREE